MSEQKHATAVPSPCVHICALDEQDVCIGCYRTGMEIARWGGMNNDEKHQVMTLVRERESKAYI